MDKSRNYFNSQYNTGDLIDVFGDSYTILEKEQEHDSVTYYRIIVNGLPSRIYDYQLFFETHQLCHIEFIHHLFSCIRVANEHIFPCIFVVDKHTDEIYEIVEIILHEKNALKNIYRLKRIGDGSIFKRFKRLSITSEELSDNFYYKLEEKVYPIVTSFRIQSTLSSFLNNIN